jgi:YggT family protein
MIALRDTLLLILNIAYFLVLAHFIMSWLVSFQVLNVRQPLVAQVWDGLNRLLQPVYSRIRRFLPAMGGLDLSPIVLIVVIFFLQRLVATQVWY